MCATTTKRSKISLVKTSQPWSARFFLSCAFIFLRASEDSLQRRNGEWAAAPLMTVRQRRALAGARKRQSAPTARLHRAPPLAAVRARAAREATSDKRSNDAAWWKAVAKRSNELLAALFGDLDVAKARVSRDELDVAIAVACALCRERMPLFRRGDSRATRRIVSKLIGVNRHKCAWRPMVASELASLRPRFTPIIGTRRRLFDGVRLFVLDVCSNRSAFEQAVRREELNVEIIVISVDWDAACEPTWVEDVCSWREWLPRRLEELRGAFPDFSGFAYVHFSPECRELCMMVGNRPRMIAQALWLVLCGMALIIELAPPAWTMECSYLGPHALARHSIVAPLDVLKLEKAIHFCEADGHGNWKPGQWWTNIEKPMLDKIYAFSCEGEKKCLHKYCASCHRRSSQLGPSYKKKRGVQPGLTREQYMGFPWLIPYRWLGAVITEWLPSKPWQRASPH